MKGRLKCAVVAALIALLATDIVVSAETEDPGSVAMVTLCDPSERMSLLVEDLSAHAEPAGLTRERIRIAVESRLRGARIYDADAKVYLYVRITVGEPATGSRSFPFFDVSLTYNRWLRHPRFDISIPAATWNANSAGQGDTGFVLETLNGHVDRFIVDYLRVSDHVGCKNLRSL